MRKSICSIPHVTRRRRRIFTLCTVVVAILFVFYQLKYLYLVSHQEPQLPSPVRIIKGVHHNDNHFYIPLQGKFKCFLSGEVIDFRKVNDDYCDCADSTDEPGTNACRDGDLYGFFKLAGINFI